MQIKFIQYIPTDHHRPSSCSLGCVVSWCQARVINIYQSWRETFSVQPAMVFTCPLHCSLSHYQQQAVSKRAQIKAELSLAAIIQCGAGNTEWLANLMWQVLLAKFMTSDTTINFNVNRHSNSILMIFYSSIFYRRDKHRVWESVSVDV